MSVETRDAWLILATSLVTVACCASLQVQSVLYQTWAACRSFALTLLVLGVIAVAMLA